MGRIRDACEQHGRGCSTDLDFLSACLSSSSIQSEANEAINIVRVIVTNTPYEVPSVRPKKMDALRHELRAAYASLDATVTQYLVSEGFGDATANHFSQVKHPTSHVHNERAHVFLPTQLRSVVLFCKRRNRQAASRTGHSLHRQAACQK